MTWDVEKIVYSILGGTGFLTIIAPKVIEQWDKRHPEAAKKRSDDLAVREKQREIEREDAEADQSNSEYWKGETIALRDEIKRLRQDMADRHEERDKEIAGLKQTIRDQSGQIERQQREILSLKGQIFDLQKDRARQTTEGQRQTDEGVRQTEEGKRQTLEGERLHDLKQEMDEEENGS